MKSNRKLKKYGHPSHFIAVDKSKNTLDEDCCDFDINSFL